MTSQEDLFPVGHTIDEKDTQPFTHGTDENNREYVPAVWSPGGGPGGSPKVSGGYEKSRTDGQVPTRGLNRKDQRYAQPEATLIANRQARALSEAATTVVTQGSSSLVELRSPSGNNYDLANDGLSCDCPDFWRLRESGYNTAVCKHCYIVQNAITAVGGYANLPWSTSKLAEVLGTSERNAQDLCRRGQIAATKIHNVWVIGYNPSVQAQIDAYVATFVKPHEWPKPP